MGLVASGTSDPSRQQITARVPAGWGGKPICASVVSSDGRYEARGSYIVPEGWQGGELELAFPTRFGAELREFEADDMGVMVSDRGCDAPLAEPVLVPAAWNASGFSGSARLLVNSFRAEETYLIVAEHNLDITCAPLANTRRTAFDTECELPQELLDGGGVVMVELNRVRRGAIAPADYFTIDLR